jgi:conjugative relaxase-like TrwC/TraI family protein
MRSIHTAKEGNKAKRDYYTKDKSLGQGDSGKKAYYGKGEAKSLDAEMTEAVWFGKDAKRLNLVGYAQQSDFEQIYDGFIPGTNERIRFEKPRSDHKENCLYDLVFSCKKSVSMQIHLGKDERLYKAHQETVLEVAELIEKDYAQAKRQVNGERHVVQTEGIIAVLMPHHTTREQDMGVHTHLLIANGTYRADGVWRSLRDVGLSHAYYLGDYFSARLAARVQELGYEIRETVTEQGHPSWELAGYTDEQIKVFSKRSENVEVKELIAAGYSRDDALLATRRSKDVDETIEQMQERWGTEAQSHRIEAIEPQAHPVTPKRQATAEAVLESAIRHYSHNSVHFSRDEIREYAFKLNRSFDLAQLDEAMARHPELIDYGKFGKYEDFQQHFTTAKALEREIRTVKAWMQGQGQATAILERDVSAQALEELRVLNGWDELKSGQREAVIGVLASMNQHQCIHGLSGVGKTSALKQLKALMDNQGVEIIGLAPSIPAAQTLGEELGIETQTVQKFIRNDIPLRPGQFIVIDESGMDSADMLDVVMQKANAVGARVLLVGDTGQNQAIEAGSPMRSVMAHGAETHHIAEIIRQQDDIQRQAVELIAKGNGLDALSLLSEHDYVTQIEDRDQRVNEIADDFVSLPEAEQAETLIVTGTNAEKDAISAAVRTRQKAKGMLGEPVKVTGLDGQKLTLECAKQIETYTVGQKLTLKRKLEKTSTKTPDAYTVMAVEGEELVLLRSATDTLYRFNTQHQKFVSSVNVTQLRDRALSPEQASEVLFYRVGDYVSLSRNYKTTRLEKDTPYQVMAKEGDEVVVSSVGGRLYRLNPKHYRDKKVFSGHEFDIAVGDSLRWTSTNRDKGQINGKTIQVTAINGPIATAFTQNGERLEIDLRRPLAVDYTLCSTSYRIQGSDRPNVLASATSDPTSNREPFYVTISRQIKKLKIWTDSYEGLKRRVAESNVQRNPIELLFGDDHGSPTASGDPSKARPASETKSGVTGAKSAATGSDAGSEVDDEQRLKRSSSPRQGRDGELSDRVRGAAGEPEALRDSGRDSGVSRDLEGIQGPTDQFGADAWRDVLSSELRGGRDQELDSEVAQQRLDESATDLRSRIERVISSLDLLAEEGLVHDSGLVESTREVVEALEPIVSGLEVPSVPVPPKRDLSSAMARAVNALTAVDSEQVFNDSGIINEIKSLVSRVEAHTLAQERLVNPGEHHVRQNSSSKSTRRNDVSNTGNDRAREDTLRTGFRPLTGEPIGIGRDDAENGRVASRNGGADQEVVEASRRQERYLSFGGAIGQNGGSGYRDPDNSDHSVRNPGQSFAGTSGLQAIADEIVRVRLQRELAEPLARLQLRLIELRGLKQIKEQLQTENKSKLHEALSSAKVEVLDSTLTEWRSLRQEADPLQFPELAIAPSEVASLTELLENYPAQKAIEYAMAEFYQAREQAIETKSTPKTETHGLSVDKGAIGQIDRQLPASPNRVPKPRTNSPPQPKPKQSTASPGRTTPPAKPQKQIQRSPVPKPVKSEPITAFWQPDYSDVVRPSHINEKHWNEWVGSRVHPEVIQRRLQSIEGEQVIENLLAKKLEFLGSFEKVGQEWKRRKVGSQIVTSKMRYEIDQYQSLAEGGGWWVDSGDDPRYFPELKPGQMPQRGSYGTFKPDMPREDRQKTQEKQAKDPHAPTQYRKYENPAGTKQELFERDLSFADVPDSISDRIFEKYGVVRTDEERRLGVWYTVWRHPEIPIYRVEGDKKDAALTSQGRFVISGQGINAGYRAKDQHDVKLPKRVLHPQLELFAVPGREIRYAFDADENRNAILNVRRDMVREAELVEARGSSAYNIPWKPEQGKGVDDLINLSGPLAFEKADLNAQPIEHVARIHYRTEYNKLARQVRRENPKISAEHLDIEIYLRAIAKGELKDGDRVLSQSDQARSLKDPDQVQSYIEHIKVIAPQYLQQQRELAAARQQQTNDRAEYRAIAQQLKTELGDIPADRLDMEVCLRVQANGTQPDRILSQSDYALALTDPAEVQEYIDHIKAIAPQYQQQKELAAAQVAEQAKAQRLAQQSVHDRASYEQLAQQVRNQLVNIPPKQFDAFVYKWAQAKGLDGDQVLAQSDIVRSVKNPKTLPRYISQMKQLANRLLEVPGADVSNQQRQFNERALKSCAWLAENYGKKQADGWTVFEGNQFSYHAKDGEYKIYSLAKHRNVLELKDNRLVCSFSSVEVEKIEAAVATGKAIAEQNLKAAEAKIQEKRRARARRRQP